MATLTQEWICFILFRFVMPIIYLAATIFRYNFFSLIYGILLLVNALLYRPTYFSITRGSTGKYLLFSMVLTSFTLLCQSIFQIYAAIIGKQQYDEAQEVVSLLTQQQEQLTSQQQQNLPEFSEYQEDRLITRSSIRNNFNTNDQSSFNKSYLSFQNDSFDDISNSSSGSLNNCSVLEIVLQQIGLQRLQQDDPLNIIRILCPDVACFVITLICLWCCQAWLSKPTNFRPCCARAVDEQICKCANIVSLYLGNSTSVALIAMAGILRPSLISLVYFLVVLVSMTMWSLVVRRRLMWFQRIRFFTVSYAGMHLLAIYLRQFSIISDLWSEHVGVGSLVDRLLGLTGFITSSEPKCSKPQFIYLKTNLHPLCYIHLAVIIILYFLLAAEIRRWMLKMKFFSIRSILNANSIHQKILLKTGDPEEGDMGNDDIMRPNARQARPSTERSTTTDQFGSTSFGLDSNRNPMVNALSPFYAIKEYALKQSYIGTLIVMMVWSIMYHSWLTFAFLMCACFIWIMPLKRSMCQGLSPIILFYAIGLLIVQYIYGLNLTEGELPRSIKGNFELRDIGLVKYDNPAGPLAIKLLFTCVFWLTLRHLRERKSGWPQQTHEILLEPMGIARRSLNLAQLNNRESEMIRNIGLWIWHTMCKYWIFACAGLFLFISLQEAVVFRLIYMSMFLYFVITFQVSYTFWRATIKVFWWVVILYSMIVLVCIYTYQFDGFPNHWTQFTGMTKDMLLNLGLKEIDTTELFIDLLTPTSFLIVVSIQLHYFQNDFLKMSDLNRFKSMENESVPERRETVESGQMPTRRVRINARRLGVVRFSRKDRFLVLCTYVWTKFYIFLNMTSAVLWRFVEVHIFKVTVTTIFICCITDVSALNTLMVMVVVILLPFPRLHSTLSILEMILSSAILLFKMIYQMNIIVDDLMSSNCTSNITIYPPFHQTLNNTDFIGIHKVKNMARYLMIYIIMILMLSLESIVRYHQIQHYRHPLHHRPMDGIVFSHIKRQHADQGLTQCFKFFINYFFYKFGKELCFIISMTTMVVRLDLYSVVYGVFLGVLLMLHRRHCAIVWPVYIILLVILIIAQYLSCVGAPPALCWVYPWSKDFLNKNLKIFLYLPDYDQPPNPHKLIGDYFQLLFACLQWNVFSLEAHKLDELGGDDNESIVNRLIKKSRNPQSDFLSYKDSYLDYIKTVLFFYSFWVTLMVVFISGTSRISLFCMGYLVGCFVFLWFGEGMLLKPLKKLTNMWMGLLMYCYLVLLAKCVLQLVGCVYISQLNENHCWVIQLFNIVCLKSSNYEQDADDISRCKMSIDEAGMSWDALCFVFLLFMLRIFKTWYFQHVVNELSINNKLAARGAELINNKMIDDINMVRANEERVLQNIKLKMDRIRTKHAACMQARMLTKEQFDDHYTIIRSGDYYMFKDVNEEDQEITDGVDTVSEEEDSNKEHDDWRRKRTTVAPTTLLATAFFGGGPKEALSLIEKTSNFSRSISISSAREYTTPDAEMSPTSILDGTTSTMLGSEIDDLRPSTQDDYSSTATSNVSTIPSTQPPVTTTVTSTSSPPADKITTTFFTTTPHTTTYSTSSLIPPVTSYQKGLRLSDVMPCLPEVTLEMENELSPMESRTVCPSQQDESTLLEGKKRRRDEGEDVEEEEEEVDEDDDVIDETTKKVETGLKMCKVVLIGFIDTLILRINNSTRHYRSVSLKLHEEKEREKLLAKESLIELPKLESSQTDEDSRDGNVIVKEDEITNRKRKENEFHNTMPRVIVLIIAISEALVARTDLLCYFAMIFNTLMSASVLSIVYPLSVFFWAMLSVPRPTKFYWVAAITYTEFIIVLKYLFQFNFYPWNSHTMAEQVSGNSISLPQMIGIEKKENYAALDFFVLFCLFIHRMMLKKRGLWTHGQRDDSSKQKFNNTGTMGHNNKANESSVTQNNKAGGDDQNSNLENVEQKKPSIFKRLLNPIISFYMHITHPKYSAVNDVFAPMFACDLFTFLIVVFGYNKFGPSEQMEDSDVATVIQQSRVPVPFLAMLLVQFLLIIIDRALYLRKLVFGKFIYHIILVIIVHIWMFFLLPIVTDIPFVKNRAAQLWYFTKCIYFGFSCYQVRSGYPMRISGNFLTKKFGYFNLFCFKGFLAIPFLLELRALTDWMWTDTTLALTSWLQMEDIYANVFVLKCWRKIEHDSPTPRAIPRHPIVKYGLGGLVLFLLIFIIWLPLLLFSMSSSIYEANPPISVKFQLNIGSHLYSQPIFKALPYRNQLTPIETADYANLKRIYLYSPKAYAFLSAYREEDVYKIKIGGTSVSTWEISYPTERNLLRDLQGMRNMSFSVDITITRDPPLNGLTERDVSFHYMRHLNSTDPEDKHIMKTMARMINGSYFHSVKISRLFPRYLTVPSRKHVNESGVLYYSDNSYNLSSLTNIVLSLRQKPDDKSRWWEMKEECSEAMKMHDPSICSPEAHGSLILAFSERIPKGVLTYVNNYGVIGLYVSVILVIGRFVRMQSVGNIQTIMFTNLPYVERLYGLCMDIYLVRQAREFAFEELLFAKLNFLYRSSETMIAWTRHPKPKND